MVPKHVERAFFASGLIVGVALFSWYDFTAVIDPQKVSFFDIGARVYIFLLVILSILFGIFEFFDAYIDPRLRYVTAAIYGIDIGGAFIFALQIWNALSPAINGVRALEVLLH